MKNKNSYFFYFVFIVFFIGYFPFLKNLYVNCDGQFYLSRIESIYLNMKDGIFLPNIQSGNMFGYGYLIDLFYPCIFYYLPAVLRFIFPVNICFYISLCLYKILFISLTYHLGKRIIKDENLVLKFILFYYSNFVFLYDILIRECFSEYIASLILPIFFLGLYDLFKNNKYRTLTLSMSLILGAHLLTLYLCCFITFICFVIDFSKNRLLHVKSLLKATLGTIILGIYFLFPFIYYFKDYKYNITLKLITINSFTDVFYLICFILFLFIIFFFMKRRNLNNYLGVALILIYVCSPLVPIEVFSFLEILQFKSRLYIFVALFICIYLAYKINLDKLKKILSLIFVYSLLFFIMIVKGKDSFNLENTDSYTGYTGNYNLSSNFDSNYISVINGEYLPKNLKLPNYDGNINSYYDLVSENLKNFDTETTIIKNDNSRMEIISDNDCFYIPKIYYPLYKVYQEGNDEISIENRDGYIYLSNVIPNKSLTVFYCNSFIQYISVIISVLFFIFIVIYQKFCKRKK